MSAGPEHADGRLRQGDALEISARQWNRMCDATDLVLGGSSRYPTGNGATPPSDCILATIKASNVDGPLPIKIGDAIGLPSAPFFKAATSTTGLSQAEVASEDDLWEFGLDSRVIELQSTFSAIDGQFGIVRQVTTEDNDTFNLVVQIRGICRCRVLAVGFAHRLAGPIPYPTTDGQKNLWRRYPVAATNGLARVLSYGNYFKLQTGNVTWPRIFEAYVFLG